MSPWYMNNRGGPMPWSGPPDQGNVGGQRTPEFTPDPSDPRNAGYFVADDPAKDAAWQQQHDADQAALAASLQNNPDYQQALKNRDLNGMMAALRTMQNQSAMQKFIDQGGSADAWNNRFKQAWPTPTMKDGTRGPGAPATAGGPLSSPAAMPPSGNPKGGPPPASVQGGATGGGPGMPLSTLDALGKLQAGLTGPPSAPLSTLPPTLGSALQNAMTKGVGGFANTEAATGGGTDRAQKADMISMINANRARAGMPPI
jgi:hypothetical protein